MKDIYTLEGKVLNFFKTSNGILAVLDNDNVINIHDIENDKLFASFKNTEKILTMNISLLFYNNYN